MKPFSNQEEERLIRAGRRYYSTAFPNPDRVGCPGAAVLEALALRKLDRAAAKQWDSHISQCSPCFNEYVALRERLERSANVRKLAAVAAVVVVGVAAWFVHRSIRSRAPNREAVTGHNTNVTYQANLLDLRNKSALRGAEPNANESPAVLPREPLDLSVYLPTGSEPGEYEVQITQEPGKPLLSAQGNASLRDHIAVLHVNLDLQSLRPGLYLLWIRQAGMSWSYYPVLIKASP